MELLEILFEHPNQPYNKSIWSVSPETSPEEIEQMIELQEVEYGRSEFELIYS